MIGYEINKLWFAELNEVAGGLQGTVFFQRSTNDRDLKFSEALRTVCRQNIFSSRSLVQFQLH